MIKNNDQVEAYQVSQLSEPGVLADDQWSTSASTWQQIGQVVDAIGQGRKQLYEGKEYDYVFDVDVAEGVPPLKLPYNISGKLSISPYLIRAHNQKIHSWQPKPSWSRMNYQHRT
jgi:hypothetical protein